MKGYSDEAVRVPSLGSEDAEYLDKALAVFISGVGYPSTSSCSISLIIFCRE
jgi:hypothetical protein